MLNVQAQHKVFGVMDVQGFSGIRPGKTAIFPILPILALALIATLAACGGASSGHSSGTAGTSANSGGCSNVSVTGLITTDNIAGHIRYLFGISNGGSSPCALKGYPTVTINQSSITVTTTTSADTWSNVAIAPVTLEPVASDGTLTPNNFAMFALQGYDQTTNCQFVTLTIALPQQSTSVPSESPISICGGKLYVSPVVASTAELNR